MDYKDPNDEGNSARYHTGEACRIPGCNKPAGTAWSRFYCYECNVKRMDAIGEFLENAARKGTK